MVTKAKDKSRQEYPILFSAPMVRAILDGSKTQTRRIMKPQPTLELKPLMADRDTAWLWGKQGWLIDAPNLKYLCPFGRIGSFLWVRETWRSALSESHECFAYRADNTYKCGKHAPEEAMYASWKPSIHMPRKACRLILKITNIKVEQLNNISESDAIAEGIEKCDYSFGAFYKNYYPDGGNALCPVASFESLWNTINDENSWKLNPWVWVIQFSKMVAENG